MGWWRKDKEPVVETAAAIAATAPVASWTPAPADPPPVAPIASAPHVAAPDHGAPLADAAPAPSPVAFVDAGAAHVDDDTDDTDDTGEAAADGDSLLREVTADLAGTDTGIEFVYRSLDRMRRRVAADDLVVVLEDECLGRQAFRAGRRPIETAWARELVDSGGVGVHATPAAIDEGTASSVLQLCSLALRLDVARHDSLHDGLTGLLNRRAFDEVLANSCAQSARYGWPFALVLLDLDGFKGVNDRLGHAAGDATLQAVGAELRYRLRVGDAAARVGGDEFALVLPNVPESSVRELVERLERALGDAVPEARVTLTSGFASAPADGHRPADLYGVADARLYEGKQR